MENIDQIELEFRCTGSEWDERSKIPNYQRQLMD